MTRSVILILIFLLPGLFQGGTKPSMETNETSAPLVLKLEKLDKSIIELNELLKNEDLD